MMARLLRRLLRRPPQTTDKLKALQQIQAEACAERRWQETLQRELAIYRHDRVSLRKPGEAEGTGL